MSSGIFSPFMVQYSGLQIGEKLYITRHISLTTPLGSIQISCIITSISMGVTHDNKGTFPDPQELNLLLPFPCAFKL